VEFKGKIASVVENIYEETLVRMMESFSARLQMIMNSQGSHIVYVYVNNELLPLTCSVTANSLMSVEYADKCWYLQLMTLFLLPCEFTHACSSYVDIHVPQTKITDAIITILTVSS
jgi:hypothetical protein